MIRTLLRDEKPFIALLGVNGALASVHKFFITHQPEMTSLLTVLQIIIAAMTIFHFSRKYVQGLMKAAREQEEKAKKALHEAAMAARAKLNQNKEPQ
jgi:hypothetical protein